MFVHVILVHMVKMAVVKKIQMAVMANRGVPAFRAMLMSVVGMVFLGACGHCRCSLPALGCRSPVIPFNNGRCGSRRCHRCAQSLSISDMLCYNILWKPRSVFGGKRKKVRVLSAFQFDPDQTSPSRSSCRFALRERPALLFRLRIYILAGFIR